MALRTEAKILKLQRISQELNVSKLEPVSCKQIKAATNRVNLQVCRMVYGYFIKSAF